MNSRGVKLACINTSCIRFNKIIYRRFDNLRDFICPVCKTGLKKYPSPLAIKQDMKAKQELRNE